jgi:ribosomal protein L22
LIDQLGEEIALATSYEQLQQAALSLQKAMAAMPTEPALFHLNAQVDRQIREHENRRLVDDTVQACRDLSSREALALVRQARQRVPGDERLLSLEALLDERSRQQTVEERRAEQLSRAREALNSARYSEAIQILEACESDGTAPVEVRSLLDFARQEEAEQRRQELLRKNLSQAQSLIRDAAYDEAITFLEATLRQTDDTAMHLLLDQATAARETFHQQMQAGLASAEKLAQAGKHAEAIQLLQTQPAAQRSVRVQVALAALQEELQQAVFRMIGRAYGILETDIPAGEAVIRRVAAASGNSPLARSLADSFRSRGQVFADRLVADVIDKCKLMFRNHEREAAGNLLQSVSGLIDYASPKVKADWQQNQRKSGEGSLLSRLRT